MLKTNLHHQDSRCLSKQALQVILALWVLCIAATLSAAEPVFSRANKFKIPFQFDQDELKKIGAEEIQLFVSTNMGASWRLYDSVKPDAGKFTYEAMRDGEYWFSVRTRTMAGVTYPSGEHEAGLKVIVDTELPVVSIDLTETKAGEVELQWKASDAHLIEDSLELEFLDPTLKKWETVQVRPAGQGKTSWSVPKAGLVEVRGRIKDQAGNVGEIASQTIVAGILPPSGVPADATRPIAKNDSQPQMLSNQPLDVSVDLATQGVSKKPQESEGTDLILPSGEQSRKTPVSPVSNGNQSKELQPVEKMIPEASESILGDPFLTEPPKPTPLGDMDKNSSSKPAVAEEMEVKKAPQKIEVKPAPLSNLSLTPHKIKGHLVNSRTFRIAYQLEDVGPSGVSQVELYITEDGGKKWFHYGSDEDRTSPFVATVPREGTYGFAFRIRNGAGIVATPPQPGDRPEIVISVDQTKPDVTVKTPVQAVEQGKLKIEWEAKDLHLDANAVAIYYSLEPKGPWKLIDGWKPNSNQFLWNVPEELVSQCFLRVDVRDSAGNVTRTDLQSPTSLDTSKPTARVIEIESIENPPR